MAKICDYPGCSNPVFSKGKCTWHQIRKPLEKSNKPIRIVSEKMASNLAKYRRKRDKYFQEHPVCEFPGCVSREITLHHRKGRVGAFLTDKRWFCSLCHKHHRWAEENPIEAQEIGLSFKRLGK